MKRSDITDLDVVVACANREKYQFISDKLKEKFPLYPIKVIMSAIERASDRRYLDYGVSLRTGWLTDNGKALLESSDCKS